MKELYNEYKNILDTMRQKDLSVIKLEILDNLQDFDNFYDLSNDERIKLIDLIYDYYMSDDWYEYNLYNFIDVTMKNISEIKDNDFDETFYFILIDKKMIG